MELKTKLIAFRATETQRQTLTAIAQSNGVSVSGVIQSLIDNARTNKRQEKTVATGSKATRNGSR